MADDPMPLEPTADPPPRTKARPRDEDFDDDVPPPSDAMATLIPYRNKWALAAWYVGIFSLLPIPAVNLFVGVAAVVFGIVGLVKAMSDPKAKGTVHATLGLLLGLASVFLCAPVTMFLVWLAYFS